MRVVVACTPLVFSVFLAAGTTVTPGPTGSSVPAPSFEKKSLRKPNSRLNKLMQKMQPSASRADKVWRAPRRERARQRFERRRGPRTLINAEPSTPAMSDSEL